jgi:hypothetical protein
MPFAARRLAAVAVLIAICLSLASVGVAMGKSGTITHQDCVQGTIKDTTTGQPIPRARCEALVGRNVRLASTGFDLRPVIAIGAVFLLGAAAFGMRRRGAHRLT